MEKYPTCLILGMELKTQTCALTGNGTGSPWFMDRHSATKPH